jgi:hypothetical protein
MSLGTLLQKMRAILEIGLELAEGLPGSILKSGILIYQKPNERMHVNMRVEGSPKDGRVAVKVDDNQPA